MKAWLADLVKRKAVYVKTSTNKQTKMNGQQSESNLPKNCDTKVLSLFAAATFFYSNLPE